MKTGRMKRGVLAGLLLVSAIPVVAAQTAPGQDILEELKLFSRALGAIMEGYVDEVQPRKMFYEAVRGMTKALDPYCEFFDPEKFELLTISIKGEYAGIGTWIQMKEGNIVIEKVSEGSAAAKAGLLAGDVILKIDGALTAGKDVAEAGRLLRGEEGVAVMLQVRRLQEVMDIKVVREKIEIESVRDVRIVGKAVGYMNIVDFQENTAVQADKALETLEKQGMKALIIDLRSNQGGLMTQAVALASRFLPKGTMIVKTSSRLEVQRKDFVVEEDRKIYGLPVIILVNQLSASASEIFSAAMQDHKRARLVGMKTFGKASVQSVVPLDEKTAMKITTARYLTPSGRKIDAVGIEPDFKVEDSTPENPQAQNQIRTALELFKEYYEA